MLPGGRPLIAICYKYNAQKVHYFIVTDNTGSTQAGISYFSKYPGQFANVGIHPVSCPHVMSKFFGSVNEVDSHNKSRQSDLVLEKLWITKCGWL